MLSEPSFDPRALGEPAGAPRVATLARRLPARIYSINIVNGTIVTKDLLGEFEHQVLLAALRLGRDAYSAAVVLELECCTARDVAPAAVYIALRRLEADGLVRTQLREGEGRGGRRARRYVTVTPRGVALLRLSRRRLLRLWDGLEPVLTDR